MFGFRGSLMAMAAAVGVLVTGSAFAAAAAPAKAGAKAGGDQVAVFETSKGRMVVEFWDKDAPKTVANFKKLARSGFYNGTGFHRIMSGFMIQGGDPGSKNPKAQDLGGGGPGWTIPDEFNAHKHVKGVLSMAHTGEPNSGGSQFFIMHGDAPGLDGKYAAFGHVIQGMDVVDAIASVKVARNPMMPGNEMSKPLEWVTLKSVKIVPKSVAMGGGKVTASAAKKDAAGAGHSSAKKTEPSVAKAAEDKAPSTTAPAAVPAPGNATNTNEAAKAPAGGAPTDSSAAK